MAAEPLLLNEFSAILEGRFAAALAAGGSYAVALSGGPDSMALARLLSEWAKERGAEIHAITVDHGLRPESATEAAQVGKWVKDCPNIRHVILQWHGDKPEKRVQEEARNARYGLMEEYCRAHNIRHIFLAHHQDDQAETFLMRLAAGSGLDGLTGMKAVQPQGDSLALLRPLLTLPKDRLLATCAALAIPYITDPSNAAERFARVRLRKSVAALEAEGLTSKRLAVTAERLERARQTLDIIAEKAQASAFVSKNPERIVFKYKALQEWPEEIVLRVLIRAMKEFRPPGDYLPRMEKIETLFADFMNAAPFTKRTLGGLIFERDDKEMLLIVSVENKGLST